ncbi:MAG: type II toxin-antitoxin system MqsR family toxin [Selenomonadaceae bacterium]|nr:type II toxin-antitoxin system MqsR family toxin [Selenomonadaceae bacterium]
MTPKKFLHKIVLTMESQHFYKSMTSYADHKIWQDVYHVPCGDLILYVKFTQNVISEFTLLSFKEK